MPTVLGRLEHIDPRSVWQHEAHDFTPWLAENIAMLGEVLGMDLEVTQRERSVGSFSVDIEARELGRDRVVVIENQLETTDHSHLGQLITYAAGLEAGVVVWVCREFRDEHRVALDWLNRGSGGASQFFGVVLEVLRIGESAPAANLRLVASPVDWTPQLPQPASDGEISDKRVAYREFFQGLIDELREKHRFTNARAGQPQNWYSFASGTTGFVYGMSFAASRELRAEIYIDKGDQAFNKGAFDSLFAQKAGIEAEFGAPLRWERLDNKRASRIGCYTRGTIEDAEDELERHKSWAVEALLRLKKVFGPRLAAVAAAGLSPAAP
jgi:hypothetical protein